MPQVYVLEVFHGSNPTASNCFSFGRYHDPNGTDTLVGVLLIPMIEAAHSRQRLQIDDEYIELDTANWDGLVEYQTTDSNPVDLLNDFDDSRDGPRLESLMQRWVQAEQPLPREWYLVLGANPARCAFSTMARRASLAATNYPQLQPRLAAYFAQLHAAVARTGLVINTEDKRHWRYSQHHNSPLRPCYLTASELFALPPQALLD